jgi:hypothetical protein
VPDHELAFVNRLRRHPLRAWLSGLALASLLALQTLGAMHGVAHAGGHGNADASGIAKLFGGHAAGSADCHLYDQLAHADLAAFSSTPPAALPPQGVATVALPASLPAAAPRFFQARAPPPSA